MKKILFLLLALFTILSCSKKEVLEQPQQTQLLPQTESSPFANLIENIGKEPEKKEPEKKEPEKPLYPFQSFVEREEILGEYPGTYLPEIYIEELKRTKSHRIAMSKIHQLEHVYPDAIFFSPSELNFIYNFHEGCRYEIVFCDEQSVVIRDLGKDYNYSLKENKFLFIDDVKYVRIADAQTVDIYNNSIKTYVVNTIFKELQLTDGSNTFSVKNGVIKYNGCTYELSLDLVAQGKKYDVLSEMDRKFVEVLDNKINIYNASSEDGNYEIGWLSNAIYTLEASFKF